MSEPQGRGYILAATHGFLLHKAGETKGAEITAGLSPELKETLATVKPAGWYPVELFGELNRALVDNLSDGSEDSAREVLLECGRYMGREASNTFLRLLMKVMTPNTLAKKLPDFWKRDFSVGRVEVEAISTGLIAKVWAPSTHHHINPISAGWAGYNLEMMGKTIEKIILHGWSLSEPVKDGSAFEFVWRD